MFLTKPALIIMSGTSLCTVRTAVYNNEPATN